MHEIEFLLHRREAAQTSIEGLVRKMVCNMNENIVMEPIRKLKMENIVSFVFTLSQYFYELGDAIFVKYMFDSIYVGNDIYLHVLQKSIVFYFL